MELLELNPWWENKSAIEGDKNIKDLSNLNYVHVPEILNQNFLLGNIYTIRGPRQIGKTTFLKQFIRERLKNYEEKSIFYWTCDNLNNYNQLIDLLREYSEYCKVNNVRARYVLIDEVTSIENWQKAIKFVVDNDILSDVCFILTGSNIIDLKKGSERLPGRRGKEGKDIFYMPLNFREYIKLIDPEFFSKHKNDSLERLKFVSNKIKTHFRRYLKTGGIPLVINEHEKYNTIPSYIYELYYSWIVGDIFKEGKNEQTLKELMKTIIETYTSSVSWDNLAKKSSIKSHLTVSSYIELLSNLLVAFPVFFKDINQNKIIYKKNKKIYFYDQFILNVFLRKLNMNLNESQIIESIVGSEIKQKDILNEVFFTNIKKETDFITGNTGIEVKYQNEIKKEDFQNSRYFKDYLVLSKDKLDKNTIPVHLYLFKK